MIPVLEPGGLIHARGTDGEIGSPHLWEGVGIRLAAGAALFLRAKSGQTRVKRNYNRWATRRRGLYKGEPLSSGAKLLYRSCLLIT
jgi:hypothetical protein